MLISIITPTFNSAKYIEKNLESIFKQDFQNYEHIIVDNLSSDKTIELVKNFYEKNKVSEKLKVICEKDNGISDAFNKGIRNAGGDCFFKVHANFSSRSRLYSR